jgi:non-haem dioxygenase in morphine synthesis N-terminal
MNIELPCLLIAVCIWGFWDPSISSKVGRKSGRAPLRICLCDRARIPGDAPKSIDPLNSQSARMLRVLPKTVRGVPRLRKHHRLLATVADPRETGFKIPIVDFSGFLHGSDADKSNTARQILEGFTSSGFIYLSNAGIDGDTVSNTFAWSKKFFALPTEEKLKLAWETPESNRGYVAPGREKVSTLLDQDEIGKLRSSNPDLKESMEIGKEPSDKNQVSLRRSIVAD